jgi:CrcB protein
VTRVILSAVPLHLRLIFLGGGIGSALRYLVSGWMQRAARGPMETFPVGTLSVNVIGCLLIGLLAALFSEPRIVREETRSFLLIGILGGFTTFSTFGYETIRLIEDRQWSWAIANIAITNVACLCAVWIMWRAGRTIS